VWCRIGNFLVLGSFVAQFRCVRPPLWFRPSSVGGGNCDREFVSYVVGFLGAIGFRQYLCEVVMCDGMERLIVVGSVGCC
jgi:hypothetical protein